MAMIRLKSMRNANWILRSLVGKHPLMQVFFEFQSSHLKTAERMKITIFTISYYFMRVPSAEDHVMSPRAPEEHRLRQTY